MIHTHKVAGIYPLIGRSKRVDSNRHERETKEREGSILNDDC